MKDERVLNFNFLEIFGPRERVLATLERQQTNFFACICQHTSDTIVIAKFPSHGFYHYSSPKRDANAY